MSVIACTDLCKSYGKFQALKEMTFTIEENKITGIIGRSGAGKTTLLKVIAGYLKPSAGEIRVMGENPFNSLKVSSRMIFVDEAMAFPNSLNLSEIMEVASSFYPNWDSRLAKGLLAYFSLNPRLKHRQLSKGKASTFHMILGLCAHCELTIFDEPTLGMDVSVRKDFYKALLKDYIACPRTILLSSHLLNEIEDILEDILLIHHGRLRLQMPTADMKSVAIGLQGERNAVFERIQNRKIYHQENKGKNGVYAVVLREFSDETLQSFRVSGIDISPVSASDLCIYLTAKTKGGIDDVFTEAE